MRVVCNLAELLKLAGLRRSDLRKKLGVDIDARTVRKICDGASDWRLDRDQLFALIAFADEHERPLFEVRAPAVWKTFEHSEARVFRCTRSADAAVESHISKFFEHIGCAHELKVDCEDRAYLQESIDEHNCLIVGAPIAHPASEIVLAGLWGAKPFDSSRLNRGKVALQFVGRKSDGGRESVFVADGSAHALVIHSGKQRRINVDWYGADTFKAAKGTGSDAAAIVARRRTNREGRQVTTLVVAGYRGHATIAAARALTQQESPITDSELNEKVEPIVAVYRYIFRKRPTHTGTRGSTLLEEVAGSGMWLPPWGHLYAHRED
jgi:hypothetical protein